MLSWDVLCDRWCRLEANGIDRSKSLPSKISFLMLAGMKCAELTVKLPSVVAVDGTAATGVVTVPGVAATGRTSKTPTLAWTSWIDVVKVLTMACN